MAQDQVVRLLRDRARLWKRAAFALGASLVLGTTAVWAAVSITDSTGVQGMYAEVFGHDETQFAITALAPQPSSGRSSSGTAFGAPVEMSLGSAVANNGPSLLDWEYVVRVDELADGSVPDPGASVYKATLYMNGVSKGSLYFDQATAEAGVERVTLVWDIGTSLPSAAAFLVDIRLADS